MAVTFCDDITGYGADEIGAFVLMMGKDDNGVYHASFDCWQQYVGYIDLYDSVFNAATSMRKGKFPFDIDDYIL